jgi:predicted permease
MNALLQDLRYGLRMLAKNPGFTAVAVLTLALGIGANTVIFSVVDAVFLRSLPVEHPDELVWMYSMRQGHFLSLSFPDYQDLCRQDSSFSGIIAVSRHMAQLNIDGATEMVKEDTVSENYFSALRVDAVLGRAFAAGEDWRSYRQPPVVISHGLWKRRFGADPSIVGKTVVFNGQHALVLGVVPEWFGGLQRGWATEVWFPVNGWSSPQDLQNRDNRDDFEMLGRLRPGVKMNEVRAELDTIAHRLSDAYPASNKGLTFVVSTEGDEFRHNLVPTFLALGGVGLILLICCANVSGMMLARAEARRREIAVRLTLGVGRGRLVRQLLTEGMVLALMGGGIGLILTAWLLRGQQALMPPGPFKMRLDFRVDLPVLAYALVISLLAAVISGLAPALQASKTDLLSTIRSEEGRTDRGRWWLGVRNLLSAGQVALSLTLLIGAGLFLKSLLFSESINPGFDTSKKMLIVNVAPSVNPREFFLPAVEKIQSLPGVKKATYAMRMLLSQSGGGTTCDVSIPGVEPPSGQKAFAIRYNSVGRDYFQTVGTRVLRGRTFDGREETPTNRSAIINESMARRFWPNTDPIGRHLLADGADYQIVGLVQDGRIEGIHEPPEPYVYFPFAQKSMGEATIIVVTTGDPRHIVGPVKEQIRSVDKDVMFLSIQTLKELMGWALWPDRMFFLLLAVLGCLGIFLTAVGLYGVVAYLTRRRTHEIGVRMALGARGQDVLALVVKQGLRPALVGTVVGVTAAAAVARLISSTLFGVKPSDPVVFVGGSLLVLAIALLASYIPARRATKVDPMVALRYE